VCDDLRVQEGEMFPQAKKATQLDLAALGELQKSEA
jgi:hypothetical protein